MGKCHMERQLRMNESEIPSRFNVNPELDNVKFAPNDYGTPTPTKPT